ncbi:ribulose-1,5 bisphosphate carboxylase/oxygenase large subunit N-methyltransferase, chloroplastic isoform X1 [Populus alba]|uniref:Uncharacterized protein n=1 Tax=Populus alba TaxID=43335 RepID=A0A4U5PMM4_POPAL|nr:uncharacterized protein LOC118032476 isoform X1 [Populus alba]TKR98402.1 hypothetical protein D5086_0000203460 [Populus alba]
MDNNNNKPCSSNKIIKTSDGCEIVLELSQNDPFFYKKKNLLHSMGFDIREQVQFHRSSCPDAIATILERILQIARIIHLDEVELYFGKVNDCSSFEYWSPRNEVEALNSVLSLINSYSSCERQKEMNFLQTLQDEVLKRIQEFTDKNKVESRIDRSCSCDKEKCLEKWGESNGVKTSLKIACVEGAGRGAIATKDLKVEDIALEIPVSIIISEEHVHKSDMYHILEKIDGITSETMLLLWSMKERHNCSSKFKIYFDTLPEEFKTGLSFGVDAIMALDGTLLLEEIMQAKEHLRVQYDELVPPLCKNYPEVFLPELYTWEQFLWACELWYSNSMKVMFVDGKLRTCLIPIAGFLNHSLYPHIVHYGKVDSATNTLKFPLTRPSCFGEQCCLSYGNFSSSHLITFYGFMPQGDNPYDVIPLDIDVGDAYCIEGCPTSSWTSHMVRGTWFSNNHNIFYYGLPSPLLDYLRGARSPAPHAKTIEISNLENEIEVLKDLQSTFSSMMENLGDTDLVDSDDASWDVKLALEFKDLQRRIVSSILTSCAAGLNLVQDELSEL